MQINSNNRSITRTCQCLGTKRFSGLSCSKFQAGIIERLRLYKYSVHYDLIGQTIDLRLTRNLVEAYCQDSGVAVRVRLAAAQRDPAVKPEHIPEMHRKYFGYNEHEFPTWAAGVGSKTLYVIRHFLPSEREAKRG